MASAICFVVSSKDLLAEKVLIKITMLHDYGVKYKISKAVFFSTIFSQYIMYSMVIYIEFFLRVYNRTIISKLFIFDLRKINRFIKIICNFDIYNLISV